MNETLATITLPDGQVAVLDHNEVWQSANENLARYLNAAYDPDLHQYELASGGLPEYTKAVIVACNDLKARPKFPWSDKPDRPGAVR